MTTTHESWIDYARIQTLIARYVWALDTADIRALGALFTDDAIFEDTAGNVYQGRAAYEGYFRQLMATPAFRGRQHHIDNLILTPTDWGYETKVLLDRHQVAFAGQPEDLRSHRAFD